MKKSKIDGLVIDGLLLAGFFLVWMLVLHELSHAMVGTLLGGNPRIMIGWYLHVSSIGGLWVAIAPYILGLIVAGYVIVAGKGFLALVPALDACWNYIGYLVAGVGDFTYLGVLSGGFVVLVFIVLTSIGIRGSLYGCKAGIT